MLLPQSPKSGYNLKKKIKFEKPITICTTCHPNNLYAKFDKNRSVTLAYINILAQTQNREQTRIILLQFRTPESEKYPNINFCETEKKILP